MMKLLKYVRLLALGCIVGMVLTVYGVENDAVAFWFMIGLLACLCVCALIAIADSILDVGRPWKFK